MTFEIELYESGNRKIIDDFIASLTDKTISKIFWLFDLLEKYGPNIGMPYVRKIAINLFELRIRKQESIRFFFTLKSNAIIILHGFKKKKMKIPKKEIEIAKNRLTKYNV